MREETLDDLIDAARKQLAMHPMTPEERREQIISFAYGNVHLHNPAVTRRQVESAYDAMFTKR